MSARSATARALASLTALYALASGCGSEPSDLPDVVVVVIDTLRADRLPFHGGPAENAPFLNRLAARALVFDNAWSTSSWTAPSTASIFTGLYPNEHGVRLGLRAGMAREESGVPLDRIPEELPTLATFMQSLGYRTFGASANPNVDERLGFVRGFDRFAPYDRASKKSAKPLVDKILAWRDEILSGDPFFLYVHLADPHGPYHRHPEYLRSAEPPPERNLDDLVAYDSEIRFADHHLERLFDALGVDDETLVVVTSDHGQEFLDHGGRGHGWQLYGELTRVPLLIHRPVDPRLAPRRIATNVTAADIAATVRDLVGATNAGAPAGRSLLEQTEGEGDPIFSMRTHDDGRAPAAHLHAVVRGRFKLIVHEPGGRVELYDLATDPGERSDLAAARPELARRLRAEIDTQRDRAEASPRAPSARFVPTAEMRELLEELGYGDGGPNVGPP